jgi:hypothetical protein
VKELYTFGIDVKDCTFAVTFPKLIVDDGRSITFARNWWKILLAGFVVFYGVPFVLRARREGARGVEEGLREGRQVIGEGAKKAGSAAAKAGAAYASGGASLAVSGLKRRRSRRNKRG